MKKTNNKGFSLVELIIVIAIMAILVGVLAPQYLKYVEKSRVSADKDTLDSFYTACTTAAADPEIIGVPTNSGYTTFVGGSTASTWSSEVADTIGSTDGNLKFKSKEAGGGTTAPTGGKAQPQYCVDSNGNFTVKVGNITISSKN